ncbi:MAG: murein transglycosylase, partial [Plesiomonas sp.]
MALRQWIYRACWVSVAGLISIPALAQPTATERQLYQQAKTALDDKQPEVAAGLLPSLKNYPLYPYLEYRLLTQDMSQLSAAQVRAFVQRYPTMPLAKGLTDRFQAELANRQDWRQLLTFTPTPPTSIAGQCRYYYARYATGERKIAWQGA